MFSNLLIGNEKAVLGGLSAGLLALLGQLGVNGQMTLKEAIYAIVTWVITHAVVWLSTNTPKKPTTAVVVKPENPLNGVEQITAPRTTSPTSSVSS